MSIHNTYREGDQMAFNFEEDQHRMSESTHEARVVSYTSVPGAPTLKDEKTSSHAPMPFNNVEKGSARSSGFMDTIRLSTAKVTALIKDWTPFTLIATYFIFSTCLCKSRSFRAVEYH